VNGFRFEYVPPLAGKEREPFPDDKFTGRYPLN
jgi:hypothetical protein